MSKASKGAALSSIGANIPSIFSSVLDTYRSGVGRKEDQKDRDLNRELMGLQKQAALKGISLKDLEIEQASMGLEEKKQGLKAIEEAKFAVATEEGRKKLFDTLSKAESVLKQQVSGSDPLMSRLAGEQGGIAGKFAGMEPSGKTADEITKEKVEPYQFVSPQAQGIMAGVNQRQKAESEAEADALIRERELFDKNALFEQQKDLAGIRTEGQKDLAETRASLVPKKELPTNQDFGIKPMSAEAAKTLQNLQMGITSIGGLEKAMDKDVKWWDNTVVGKFSNPEWTNFKAQAIDAVGRIQSGGAITKDEVKNFQSMLSDTALLSTKEGRTTIKRTLNEFVARGTVTGGLISGEKEWLKWYDQPAKEDGITTPKETLLTPGKMEEDEEFMSLLSKVRK